MRMFFEDNYLNVATRPYWKEVLNDYLSQYFDPNDYRVYVSWALLDSMEVSDLPKLSKEFIENGGDFVGGECIYISENACTQEEFKEFTNEFHVWLMEHQYYGDSVEYLYTKEGIEQLTPYNYTEYFGNRDTYTIDDTYAYIKYSGKIIDGEE